MTATLALAVALGGASYAASLPRNSVGTAQLKNGAVTASKIKKGVVPPGYAPATNLASGKTQVGVYSAAFGPSDYAFIDVEFRPRLATGIVASNVAHLTTGATTVQCPGPGRAAPGWFCYYDTYSAASVVAVGTANPDLGQDNKGSSRNGIVLEFQYGGGSSAGLTGVWAVTAP